MTLPILFLDVDGVLNSEAFFARQRGRGLTIISSRQELIDPEAVAHLNRIVAAAPHLFVILSSSWRLGHTTEEVADWLKAAGYTGELHGRTPRGISRGAEVAAWLDSFHAASTVMAPRAPRAPYAILDDEPEEDAHAWHWVATRYATGLTAAEADRAICVLRGSP